MQASLRLSEDAVRGAIRSFNPETLSALRAGDASSVVASHRGRWAGLVMKENEDSEDGDDDDSEDEDSDEDEEDSDDDEDDEDDADGPEGKKSKKDAEDKAKKGDPQAKIRALEDEKNRLYHGRKRARAERDDLQGQLDKLKKEGNGDEELKKRLDASESEVTGLKSQLQKARIANAFLSDNTYEWHDPGVALAAVDLNDLEFGDDGKVHGLTSALETLATEKPFLLKTEKKAPAKKTSTTSSGTPAGRKPNKSKQAAERDRIRNKYRIG